MAQTEPTRTALLIDDDAGVRETTQLALELEGYEVFCAVDGQDALDWAEREGGAGRRLSLILLDLMMPVMDGWEFLRRKSDTPRLQAVPVVVLSALGQPEGGLDGVSSVVRKPFELGHLLSAIQEIPHHFEVTSPV